MSHKDWENLDAFLNVGEFATVATIELAHGETIEVTGIFDDPYLNAQLGEYEADTSQPRFTCKWTDVLDVRRGDVARIDGQAYDVLSAAQPDGTGMALLSLAVQDQQR